MEKLEKSVSTSALHDTSTRQGDETSRCHPNTRQHLLAEMAALLDGSKGPVNWLYGPAGAGKTAIMRSLAALFEESGQFLGGFHFWRSDATRNTIERFIATLVYQLAQNEPAAFPLIEKALQKDALILKKSAKTQMEKLIIEPLLAVYSDASAKGPRCILVDGLDECDEDGQREFLENLLPTLISRLSSHRIVVFVASRHEAMINNLFTHARLRGLTNRIFLEPSPEDVREFLNAEFEEINRCYPNLKEKHGGQWPRNHQREKLIEKSSGYFILCATAMRYINPPILQGQPPDQRLDDVLDAVSADPFRPLDALYLFILRRNAPKSPGKLAGWKQTLGMVCMPFNVLEDAYGLLFGSKSDPTSPALSVWYGNNRVGLQDLLTGLGSLIYFDEVTGEPKAYHASLADFLFNRERSDEFFVDQSFLHLNIACTIIGLLNREDIKSPSWYDLLLNAYFPYHLERICSDKGEDRIGRAFDEIKWSPFLPLNKLLEDYDNDLAHGLSLLAPVYDAFECFVQHIDPPNVSLRRKHILANLFPLAQPLLEYTPKRMLDLSLRFQLWDGAFDSNLPRRSASEPKYDLLHFHSTACLIHWRFDRNHHSYTCTGSICLDEAELLARCSVMFDDGKHSEGGQAGRDQNVIKLLRDLDLTWKVGDLLSRTLNGDFPLRCAQMFAYVTYAHVDSIPDSEDINRRYGFWAETIPLLMHSAAYPRALDTVWQYWFLRSYVLSYIDEWQPSCINWRTSSSPIDAFRVKHLLQYLNRSLQNRLTPTVVTDDPATHVAPSPVTTFSELEQAEMWKKYSVLVIEEPSTLANFQLATVGETLTKMEPLQLASIADIPSITHDSVLSYETPHAESFVSQSASTIVGSSGAAGSAASSSLQAVPDAPETPSTTGKKKKRFWNRLLRP